MMVEFFSAVIGTVATLKDTFEVVEMSQKLWDHPRGRHGDNTGKVASDAIREIIAAEPTALEQPAKQAIDQAVPDASARQREILLDFLIQIPAQARATCWQTMPRPSRRCDTGISCSVGFMVAKPGHVQERNSAHPGRCSHACHEGSRFGGVPIPHGYPSPASRAERARARFLYPPPGAFTHPRGV